MFIIGCGDVGTGNETRVAERMALVHFFFYENALWIMEVVQNGFEEVVD